MFYLLANPNFCGETANIWQFLGWVLFVFKIVIPLLLILFGMIDLGKAVVSSDDKAIKSATTSLVKRAVAAVVIFFIPTIVAAIFNIVSGFGDVKEQYKVCANCIAHPGDESRCSMKDVLGD